jgi:AcrR family transcriptional regulator/biotin carboxyl carrier protein
MDTPTTLQTTPRQRLNSDERQREIVAAVLVLARERGPEAITAQAIADRIGVTQGAIFRHFPDKAAIWMAVFAWVRESLATVLATAIAKPSSPLAKIERHIFRARGLHCGQPRRSPRPVPRTAVPGRFARPRRSGHDDRGLQQAAGVALRRSQAAGELPADLDANLAPVLFIGAVQGLVIQSALAGRRGRDDQTCPAMCSRCCSTAIAGGKAVNVRVGRKTVLDRCRRRRRSSARLAGDQPGPAGADQSHARQGRAGTAGGQYVRHRHGRGAPQLRAGPDGGEPRGARARRPGRCRQGGQLLAELDPVDLDDRVASGPTRGTTCSEHRPRAEAQLAEAQSRAQLAVASARRSNELRAQGFVSQEADRRQRARSQCREGGRRCGGSSQLAAARRDHDRALSDVAGVGKLRAQARLTSPVDGVVSARLVEPGTTIVAGQAVLQIIDPATLWIKARIDQGQAGGVRVGQSAEIVLRSDPEARLSRRGPARRLGERCGDRRENRQRRLRGAAGRDFGRRAGRGDDPHRRARQCALGYRRRR